jgi:ribose 5-phosphate isomerase B
VQIALGTDEEAPLVAAIERYLTAHGHAVVRVGLGAAWPEVGREVGLAVHGGGAAMGICCCHTGTGVSIAANKIDGVRAALCGDAMTATGARRYNDANVLALGLRQTTPTVALEIVDAFLAGVVDETERPAIARVEQP